MANNFYDYDPAMAGAYGQLRYLDSQEFTDARLATLNQQYAPQLERAHGRRRQDLVNRGLYSSAPSTAAAAQVDTDFSSNIMKQIESERRLRLGGAQNRLTTLENAKAQRKFQREMEEKRRKAASRAGWMKLLGTGLGVAASFIPGVGPIAGPAVAGAFNTYGGGFDDGGQYDSNYQWDSNPGLN